MKNDVFLPTLICEDPELINAGVDLFTVGRVLGHKDPRSTQRYSHLAIDTLTAAVGKIGRKNG